MSVVVLPEPAAACADTVRELFRSHEAAVADGVRHRTLSPAALAADDAAVLRELHARLTEAGAPRRAAAKYLAGWFGGQVTAALGRVLVDRDAYLLVEHGSLRWHVHPEGWPDGVELSGARIALEPGHAWTGAPGVVTVPDPSALRSSAVAALDGALAPLGAALRSATGLGRAAFWAEVADGLGNAVAHRGALDVTEDRLDALRALIEAPAAPWKARPTVWLAEASEGPVCVLRKGGCCLAYTEPPPPDGADPGEDQLLFDRRFAEPAGAKRYCVDCRHRTAPDCEARQLWWSARLEGRA